MAVKNDFVLSYDNYDSTTTRIRYDKVSKKQNIVLVLNNIALHLFMGVTLFVEVIFGLVSLVP